MNVTFLVPCTNLVFLCVCIPFANDELKIVTVHQLEIEWTKIGVPLKKKEPLILLV